MSARVRKLICIGVIGAAFVAWAAVFIRQSSFLVFDGSRRFCLFDDAMVSLRYAWNLAHGDGLVWNPGERVEGFTNTLQTLLMSLPALLLDKGSTVLAVQLGGLLATLAVAYFTMRIGETILRKRQVEPSLIASASFFLSGLAYYPLAYWSLMGMETGLLAALLLAAVWLAILPVRSKRQRIALQIVLGLALLTRPDAAVPIALLLGYRLYDTWRRGYRFRPVLIELGAVLLVGALLTLFRLAYYGSAVPNTYTLKLAGMPLGFRLENGLSFVRQYLPTAWLPLAAAATLTLFDRRRETTFLLSLALAAVGYQIYVGGDAWLYWRMMAPTVPLTLVLVAAAAHLLPSVRRLHPLAAPIAGLVAVVAVAAFANREFFEEFTFQKRPYTVPFNHATVSVALALEQVTGEDATVGVVWAGSIPFYTGRQSVDFLGKTDPRIAALAPDLSGKTGWRGMKSVPGHNKYDLEYSIGELTPTYVQELRWGRDNMIEFVRKNYRGVRYHGIPLMLKRDSTLVDWDAIEAAPKTNPHSVPLEDYGPRP